MRQETITFDQIIAPLTRERFLSEFWNKSFLHLSGRKGRFTPLLPWEELSAILQWHCPPQPQLRMFQDGKQVDIRRYIEGQVGTLTLNVGGFISSLSQGATLILDKVQEVAPRVNELAEEMQDLLQGPTNVNVYAGWRRQNGFDLHWDPQDTIVLQLSGRKHWKVYRPTRVDPVIDDVEAPQKPTEPPIWDGILEDGDMLHVPRGWWHVAFPLEEPSLHLTVGIEPPNGADFVRWWTRRLLHHPEARKRLPRMGDEAGNREYFATLLKMVEQDRDRDLVGKFLSEGIANRRNRAPVRLPFGPIDQLKPLGLTTRIRLATSFRLHIEQDLESGMVKYRAGGHLWNSGPELVPVFEHLSRGKSVLIQELCADIHDREIIAKLMSSLETLAGAGVILKEAPENAPGALASGASESGQS